MFFLSLSQISKKFNDFCYAGYIEGSNFTWKECLNISLKVRWLFTFYSKTLGATLKSCRSTPKPWEQLQNPGNNSKTLRASTPPSSMCTLCLITLLLVFMCTQCFVTLFSTYMYSLLHYYIVNKFSVLNNSIIYA